MLQRQQPRKNAAKIICGEADSSRRGAAPRAACELPREVLVIVRFVVHVRGSSDTGMKTPPPPRQLAAYICGDGPPPQVLRLYVSADSGNDDNPSCGLEEASPCRSIRHALSESPQEIWLLGGTYNASDVSIECAAAATTAAPDAALQLREGRGAGDVLLRSGGEASVMPNGDIGRGGGENPPTYVAINGARGAVLMCGRQQPPPPPGANPDDSGSYLYVGEGLELFLSNLT